MANDSLMVSLTLKLAPLDDAGLKNDGPAGGESAGENIGPAEEPARD